MSELEKAADNYVKIVPQDNLSLIDRATQVVKKIAYDQILDALKKEQPGQEHIEGGVVDAIDNAQKRFESSAIFKKIKEQQATVSQSVKKIFSINEKQSAAGQTVSNNEKQSVTKDAEKMAIGTGHYDQYGNFINQ